MDTLAVPQHVRIALEKADLSSLESILEYSNGDLVRKTGLNASQVSSLVQLVSETLLGHGIFTKALSMYTNDSKLTNWGRLSTGCTVLDRFLEGGILPGALTEVSGTSGAGKTQFTLQLSLMAQVPLSQGGFKGQSIFVSTEGALPSGRLKQLSIAVSKRYNITVDSLMDNVLVYHCVDVPALVLLLKHKLPSYLQTQNGRVKLLLIDSIAALFRSEYEDSELSLRTGDLKTVISSLKYLIELHQLTIVCTNQVTVDVDENRTVPALGQLWSSCLNVRLVLQKDETVDNQKEFQDVVTVPRTLWVESAPHLPWKKTQYFINNDGIFGIEREM